MKHSSFILFVFLLLSLSSCESLKKLVCKGDTKSTQITPPRITEYANAVMDPKPDYDRFGSPIEPYELVVRFVNPSDARVADVQDKIDYLMKLDSDIASPMNTDNLIQSVTPCMCGDELLVLGLDHALTRQLGGVIETGEKLKSKSGGPAEVPIEVSPNYIITDAQPAQILSGPRNQNIPAADKYEPSKRDIIIAVLDTGIDVTYGEETKEEFESLRNHLWTLEDPSANCFDLVNVVNQEYSSYDIVNNTNNPFDNHSHGTHVTGIITRQLDLLSQRNGVDINYKIMPLKTHNKDGIGTYFDVLCATYFAVKNGAHVINDSWGFYGIEQNNFMDDALEYAKNHGTFVITALGNDKEDIANRPFLPSNFYNRPNVISVGSYDEEVDNSGNRFAYSYSNYNSLEQLSLLAPGTNIMSLMPGGRVARKTGTSMAAPHITAAVAYNLSQKRYNNFILMNDFFYDNTIITHDPVLNKDFILYDYDRFLQHRKW